MPALRCYTYQSNFYLSPILSLLHNHFWIRFPLKHSSIGTNSVIYQNICALNYHTFAIENTYPSITSFLSDYSFCGLILTLHFATCIQTSK